MVNVELARTVYRLVAVAARLSERLDRLERVIDEGTANGVESRRQPLDSLPPSPPKLTQ